MPWCEPCARYLAPSAVNSDGSCPTCGQSIDAAKPIPSDRVDLNHLSSAEDAEGAPWHFKLLVTALVLYLSWRIVSIFI